MNTIRIATQEDLESISAIYNQAVHSQFETADTIEITTGERLEWFKKHPPETYPVYVYEINNIITGWLSFSPYRPGRNALRFTIEISYYVHHDFKHQGTGSKLMEHAISESKRLNYKTLLAIVLDKNEASIALLIKYGFALWGALPAIADFDGTECGHVYYGLRL